MSAVRLGLCVPLLSGLTLIAIAPQHARAQSSYYDRVIFDNSLTPDRYFYSHVEVQQPSTVETIDGGLPVDRERFHTPPNALRLHWTSKKDGGWQAHIEVNEWRNRVMNFTGNTLTFWCYEPEALSEENVPKVALRDQGRSTPNGVDLSPDLTLRDENNNFTQPLSLAPYFAHLTAGKWVRVEIPLRAFANYGVRVIDPRRILAVVFSQGSADGRTTRC